MLMKKSNYLYFIIMMMNNTKGIMSLQRKVL